MVAGSSTLLDSPLDSPLFTGAAAAGNLVPAYLPVALGGHPYLCELSQYQRQTIERFRNPYDVSPEPGEHTLNYKGPWLRSTSRWGNGAGQDFWDITGSDRQRFRTSKGVDVWSNKNRLQLLFDTRKIRSSGQTNLNVIAIGAWLYITDGTEVYWTTDPTVSSPTFTAANIKGTDAGSTSVLDMTTDGATVYAACGSNGINKTVLGATASTDFCATPMTLVEYANGRLIAANGNVLYEIDGAGTATALKTHNVATFAWQTICGAPNGIYVGGNLGDRTELYFIGLKADHSLDVPVSAGSLPAGETINAMFFYNGFMLLATSVGLRLAQVTSADGLSYGAAVEITGGCAALEAHAAFVWFGWKNFDATSTGLGRANLAIFTDTLVPAYTSDLMATTQGQVLAVATWGGKRYFAVSGVGIYAEFTSRVATGTLNQGWLSYSTNELKVAISIDVRHEPLPAGSGVHIDLIAETGTTYLIGDSAVVSSLGPVGPLSVPTFQSEAFEIQITLTRATDVTTGPLLRRWTFRSLVTPKRVDEIFLPIWLKEEVITIDPAGGQEVRIDPYTEWLYLKSLEGSGTPVTYQEGAQSYTVYIEQVALPHDPERAWKTDFSFAQGLCVVHMITLDPAA